MLNKLLRKYGTKMKKTQNTLTKTNTVRRTLYAQIMNVIPNIAIFIS